MRIIEISERSPNLCARLLAIWEQSVRATHTFLSEEEILQIKPYVPQALTGVAHLFVAMQEDGTPIGFMGVDSGKLEMLFLAPALRRQGFGRKLVQKGITEYGVSEVTVNEQNPEAIKFYEAMGFRTYKRTDCDEQGGPYPLYYMKLENYHKND